MLKVILLSCLFFVGNAWAESIEQLKVKAEQGDSVAQSSLGVIYANGEGVDRDLKAAIKWWQLAAEQGDAGAQYNLGVVNSNGEGVIQNYKEAIKWYLLAAKQGNSIAQYNLGFMYSDEHGVAKDYKTAHMWFNIAAANGHEDAGEGRDDVALEMTSEDISKAQEMAREWVENNP